MNISRKEKKKIKNFKLKIQGIFIYFFEIKENNFENIL